MILITGGSGQLGKSLRRALANSTETALAPSHAELDITDRDRVIRFFQRNKPDVVLHCAAFNQVDLAEEQPELCNSVNIDGARIIAEACRETGAWLLYTSSDYVFDGEKKAPYEIDDIRRPLSVYGHSKAEAEDIVLGYQAQNMVLRISWLFGFSNANFVESILRAAASHHTLTVVNDQIGSPTYSEDLALLMIAMMRQRPSGIFQASNEGDCSRAQFAEEIIRLADLSAVVSPISSENYPSRAVRPKNSRLSKASLDKAGFARLPTWKDALARYLNAR